MLVKHFEMLCGVHVMENELAVVQSLGLLCIVDLAQGKRFLSSRYSPRIMHIYTHCFDGFVR